MTQGGGVLSGPLSWTLARRLLADPRSRLLHSSARAALLATTLGVAALGIALALMTGYREDLVARLIGGNAAVLVYPGEETAEAEIRAALVGLAGVTRATPVGYLEGVLSSDTGEAEITLRATGGDGGSFGPAPLVRQPGRPWRARLGKRLAEELAVTAGDSLRLTVLAQDEGRPRFAFRTLEVEGTFHTGFSEFDRSWVVVAPEAIAGVPGAGAPLWEIGLDDPNVAPAFATALRERLAGDALVVDWQQLNRSLFSALDLQRRALFLLLGLIVLVATFNVASTLVVLVRERMRDLGVLAAVGLPPAALTRLFLLYGGILGAVGTALGLALAAVVSWLFTRFEVLSFGPEIAEVYFLESVPLRLTTADAATIAALSLVVTLGACWLPARRAARLDPAAALRYE